MTIDYLAIAPILCAGLGALLVLVVDLAAPLRIRTTAVFGAALVSAVAALGASLALIGSPRTSFCTAPAPDRGVLSSCSYAVDGLTVRLLVILTAAAVGTLLLSVAYARQHDLPPGEYGLLVLASLTGALTLVGARDLITLLVGLETLTLPTYALVGLRRSHRGGAEAAVKYLLVSVSATAVTLLGIALTYGLTGAVHLDRIAAVLAARPEIRELPLGAAAVVLVLGGLAFKVAAVPFHWWAPDVYQGAPVPVAAYLATVSKAGGIGGLLLVTTVAFAPYRGVWSPLLAALAVGSMTWGNLVALRQTDAVRLLAWSSVAHAGYLLVPLGAVAASADLVPDAVRATAGYLALYAAVNLGAFACVIAAGVTSLESLRGLARRSPVLAGAFTLFLLGLAGLPPALAGLVAKVVVLRSALLGGAGWLAVAVALNTVLGLAYYLRVAGVLFAPAAPVASASVSSGSSSASGSSGSSASGVPADSGDSAGARRLAWAPTVAVAVGAAALVTLLLSVVPQLVLG